MEIAKKQSKNPLEIVFFETAWWFHKPSEKYESQLVLLFPIDGKNDMCHVQVGGIGETAVSRVDSGRMIYIRHKMGEMPGQQVPTCIHSF